MLKSLLVLQKIIANFSCLAVKFFILNLVCRCWKAILICTLKPLWVTQQCVFKIGNYWIGKWKKGQSSFMPSSMFLIYCSLFVIDYNSYVESVCRLVVQVLPLWIRQRRWHKKCMEKKPAASSFSIWLCTILLCS